MEFDCELLVRTLKTRNSDSNFWHATWIYPIKQMQKAKAEKLKSRQNPNFGNHEKNYLFSS
ncbi:MAG: hypothetical protein C0430_01540 [Flavobacterium sp.]|nr:hypothetical protein [Flavobacterium sp.]